jgi:hypothetical protein
MSTFNGSVLDALGVYTGKLKFLCIWAATFGSNMRETLS